MSTASKHKARTQNSVPWFWPVEFLSAVTQEEWKSFLRGVETVTEAVKLDTGLTPTFATPNKVLLDLHTMRFRDFSPATVSDVEIPTIVDAPYAGHPSSIADFSEGQSLVQTLQAHGLKRVYVTDWKSATPDMKDYDIDNYLAELNVVVDQVGGRVNLIGLCQGGWMSAMYAARFPDKVASLVLAGSPIDTDAGHGSIRDMAHSLPMDEFHKLVELGGGFMRGRFMLAAWKNMHPDVQYFGKYVDLYEHIDDPAYVRKSETFEAWYENPIDLPGRWYLQAVEQLFKENRLAKGQFVGLGKKLSLKDIRCPVTLLAGESDDITTKEQVFNADKFLGTPSADILKLLAPGGHIGLFMGSRTLREFWPDITKWIVQKNTLLAPVRR
ncbi:alpha/beta fold hydrolase [Aquabacterium sp.]|uniref:alpha/beta fold hydrolase n=1 Tax=Aquabacterium sp. TaxID=1872578 RepID=UPI0035B126C0